MRTGAIFARGSCRTLMWVLALVAVVALPVGEVVAQTPVPTPSVAPSNLTLDEGDSDTVRLTVANGTDGGSDKVTIALESIEGGTFDMALAGRDDHRFHGGSDRGHRRHRCGPRG